MGKLTSLFLIVILFGCAKDSDLLPDPVFVQKVVEIEVREPGGPSGENEVSQSALSILQQLAEAGQEMVSAFCDGSTQSLSKQDIDYSTLVHRNYSLNGSVALDSNAEFTTNLDKHLNIIREAGLQVTLLFNYRVTTEPDNHIEISNDDALKEEILEHIMQLHPTLRENSDVISCVELRFVGD